MCDSKQLLICDTYNLGELYMIDFSLKFAALIRIGFIIFCGIPLLILSKKIIYRAVSKRMSSHIGLLISKTIFYGGVLVCITMILNDLGFELTALLGAAGIAGIALGFASQTTISNMISGIFLLIERPFSIGDIITYDNNNGTIESIDILSTKIKTFNGKRIRIPNDAFIKHVVTNSTYYPHRRITFSIGIGGNHVSDVLIPLLHHTIPHPPYLTYPAPVIHIEKVTSFGTYYTLHAWVETPLASTAAPQLVARVKDTLQQEELRIINISYTL